MTEQQMPARIYIRTPLFGGLEFVRADIAERMAEALENVRTVIEFSVTPCHSDPTGTWLETLNRIDSALSAFRSATQDTEARHD
jgi:hypothetical protein